MTTQSRELLSAFLDNELPPVEVDELTEAWASEVELPSVARRYQLIGELMRANNAEVEGVYTPAGSASFSDRISAAVYEDEAARQKSGSTVVELNPRPRASVSTPPVIGPAQMASRPKRWRRSVFGGALAASITVTAVFATRFIHGSPTAELPAPGVAFNQDKSSETSRWDADVSDGDQSLQRYLVNHAEFSRATNQGVMPYARVVGYRNGVDERRR